mgnify:CR=1 FL=1
MTFCFGNDVVDTERAVNDDDEKETTLGVLAVVAKAAAVQVEDSHTVNPNEARKKESGFMVFGTYIVSL